MKTFIIKLTTIAGLFAMVCFFGSLDCKPKASSTGLPALAFCQIASEKGSFGDNFYYYDSKSLLVGYVQYDSTGKILQDSIVLQYDSAYQLTGMKYYMPGVTAPHNTATFNYSKGYLLKYSLFTNSSFPDSWHNFTHDAKGNITIDSNFINYTSGPVLDAVTNNTYDSIHNLTDLKLYSGMGVLLGHSTFAYTGSPGSGSNLPLAFHFLLDWGVVFFSGVSNIYTITDYVGAVGTVSLKVDYKFFVFNSNFLPQTAKYSNGMSTFTYNAR